MSENPQTSPGITVDVVTDSQWDTGYCNKVNVKNTSSAPVDWVVRLQPQGTINQHWSANKRDEGGAVIFDGLDWNNVLQPGQSTSFGFCANL